jgi:hypothetical protein
MGASSTSSRVTLSLSSLVFAEVRHLGIDLLQRLVEQPLQLVVLDHDGLDGHAGVEFDLVDGMQVGRIGDAEEQPLAALEQRQHPVLGQQLVRDGPDRIEVDAHGIDIEQWYSVLDRRRNRDVARFGGATGDQLCHEAGFLLRRCLQRSMHARFVDHAVLNQALRQAAEAGARRKSQGSIIVHKLKEGARLGSALV